jgi:hypothetical protein
LWKSISLGTKVARALGHGDANGAGGVARLRRAAKHIEGVTLHLHYVADHRGAVFAQRQAALIAQKYLAADAFFEPVDPAHQRGAGNTKQFGGVAKTLVPRASEERFQVIPGRIQDFVGAALRHRSTPVQ